MCVFVCVQDNQVYSHVHVIIMQKNVFMQPWTEESAGICADKKQKTEELTRWSNERVIQSDSYRTCESVHFCTEADEACSSLYSWHGWVSSVLMTESLAKILLSPIISSKSSLSPRTEPAFLIILLSLLVSIPFMLLPQHTYWTPLSH